MANAEAALPDDGPPNDEIYTEEFRLIQLADEIAELEARLGSEGESPKEETARELLNRVLLDLPGELRSAIAVDRFQCRSRGCVAVLTFADEDALWGSEDAFVTSETAMSWTGPRVRTGPMPNDEGRVESNWYLFF